MPMKIERDDDGEEIDVFTAEELEAEKAKIKSEYEAKLTEKEEYIKKKTDEFVQGKKSIEYKDEEKTKEFNTKIEEISKKAEEAFKNAESEKIARLMAVRDFVFDQYGATDAETKKKLTEAWDLVNVPMDTEENIKKRAQLAANLAGVNNTQVNNPVYGAPFSGGYAPTFKREEGLKDEDHEKFKRELGLDNFIPKENK